MSLYTAGQKMTYPWLVMHKDHVAFRMKSADPAGPDQVLMPNGEETPKHIICGNCGRKMSYMALLTKQWKVTYQLT